MSLFIAKDQTRGNTRIEWHCIQRVGKLIASCRNAILQFLKQRTCQGPRSSFESGVGEGGGGGGGGAPSFGGGGGGGGGGVAIHLF